MIDEEVRKLVSEAYQRTILLLQQNKKFLHSVAELLVKNEIIFKEDLENILGKRPEKKTNLLSAEEKLVKAAIN